MSAAFLALALVLVIGGCAGPTSYPSRTPAALPEGATALGIETAAPGTPHAGAPDTCQSALMEPVRLALEGDQVVFVLVDTGANRAVVWPRGFSARLNQGRAELVRPDGTVFARDGEVIDNIGGAGPLPEPFLVCDVGTENYGPTS